MMDDLRCPECYGRVTLDTTRCPSCGTNLTERRPLRRVKLRQDASTIGATELIGMALQGIQANKLRSAFPIVGVVFGIGTVILLMAIGRGVRLDITRQFAELGPRVITVRPGNRGEDIIDGKRRKELPLPIAPWLLHTSSLTTDDVTAIMARDSAGLIEAGTVATNVTNPVKQEVYRGNAAGDADKAPVIGTDEHYLTVRGLRVMEGRFIRNNAEDEASCVVGKSVLESLFPDLGPAEVVEHGDQITIVAQTETGAQQPGEGRLTCTIVGVMEPRGQTIVGDLDSQVYVPLRAFHKLYGTPTDRVNELEFLVSDRDRTDDAYSLIEGWMNDIKRGQANASFTILSYDDLLARFSQILTILTALVIGVSAVSLLESIVGVLTIMYVSVKERTQEIGVRKATGATEEQIVVQFLLEAVILSMLGGLVGAPLGIATAIAVDRWSRLPTHVTVGSVVLALFLILSVGVLAGAYPAWRAAKVPPRVALGTS